MSTFRKKIRSAIANQPLQAALDKNASQRLEGRDKAYRGLPEDFTTLKRKAHAIRSDVIANLDRYLTDFIAKVKANGIIVYQARDAAEAREIVLNIARQHQAHLISKSKTMMSEEIRLNPALEAAGYEVVETDLGEYIVQLRGEHPSHIITPAVHLRKEDVGVTFHQKLGIPLSDNIQILTNTARAKLRQTFLDTDIGISGVNMGVVETGDLCIVTNEGNGRMVTSLPQVHIALMGIERLVPDLDSLAVILTVLPRSATGQISTVYTQLISKPRQADEIDGASERHLVLIDNGRTRLRTTPLAEALNCIRCGACINACPVFQEIGGFSYTSKHGAYTPYPGPIGSVLSPGLFGLADYGHLAQASTLCGACKEACPVDIDLPAMLLKVRSGKVQPQDAKPRGEKATAVSPVVALGLRAFTWASTRPKIFALAQKIAAGAGKLWAPQGAWLSLPAFTGWGFSKDFPKPAASTFKDRWGDLRDRQTGTLNVPIHNRPSIQIPHQKHQDNSGQPSAVTSFANQLIALGGKFIPCRPEELGQQLRALLAAEDHTEILAWGADKLPEGLVEDLKAAGIQVRYDRDAEIKVGLTGVSAAVAETGSIVLTSGPGQPLFTSLLPEIHIAILYEDQIYKNLPQVLHLQEIQNAASVVMISGPSRTADIEMTLTIGVHGPGDIYVFCLRNRTQR